MKVMGEERSREILAELKTLVGEDLKVFRAMPLDHLRRVKYYFESVGGALMASCLAVCVLQMAI